MCVVYVVVHEHFSYVLSLSMLLVRQSLLPKVVFSPRCHPSKISPSRFIRVRTCAPSSFGSPLAPDDFPLDHGAHVPPAAALQLDFAQRRKPIQALVEALRELFTCMVGGHDDAWI